jgi:hypothetical protein
MLPLRFPDCSLEYHYQARSAEYQGRADIKANSSALSWFADERQRVSPPRAW